jgi:hypothetical protein
MHQSFLNHRNALWLKVSLFLLLICIAAYQLHDPIARPNGGTWLGYTLGTLGALLIVWLALLGVRKRSYRSSMGTVKGWTSAHVWLGLALAVVATLHSGFQFGWNIHTAAWVLMMLVIVSGLWGLIAYTRYPSQITAMRGPLAAEEMLEEISDLDQLLLNLAAELGQETHERTLGSIERTRIGGGFWRQVLGLHNQSISSDNVLMHIGKELQQSLSSAKKDLHADDTMMFMADAFVSSKQNATQREIQRKLLDTFSRRISLVSNLNADITRRARMSVWLYFHVPLTLALLAALMAHILSVFLYW